MKTILLVDDIEMNRKFIIPVFQNNYTILEAESGEDALVILKNNHVDLVITDIFMKNMDGYTLIGKIRENELLKEIPVIAITENNDASQAKAIAAGANYFISRPLASDELRKATYKLTGQDSGRRELISTDFLLETIPGAAIVYKIKPDDYEILTCSRGLSALVGWDADEFRTKVETEAEFKKIHPSDQAEFTKMIQKIVTTKASGELIYRGYKKDGSVIWLWFQGQYAGEEDGCPIIQGLILDVSNNSNMYQTILDQSASLVTIVDANTFEVLYANKAAQDTIAEMSPGQYIGSVCYEHVFHLEGPCPFCMLNNSEDDTYVNQELELDGHYYRQVFKKILWHGKDAVMEYTTDITEQKNTLEIIEQQKRLQDEILDTIPAGIMVFKFAEDGIQIVSVNRSILEMMGMDKGKALGEASHNITSLTHPDDLSIVLDAAKKMSVAGTYVEYEYRHFFRSRNDYIWVLGQGRSIANPDGYVYAYVNYTDITARKEVEMLQGKLETAGLEAATKAEFYSQMSHDMRTPMNGILGLAALAKHETDVKELQQNIEKIEQSGKYMLNLINDTLDLQRMETGRMKLEPQIVRCQDLLDEIVTMMTPSIKEKNLVFNVNILGTAQMKQFISVDALRLKQIITNILSNSVKYTKDGGSIELSIEEVGRDKTEDGKIISHDEIRITDTGIGMSKDFLENGIFKPFSQERNEMSMQYPGSGLGLSIVKKLLDLMGGTIRAESTLGTGSIFTIHIDLNAVPDAEVNRIEQAVENDNIVQERVIHGKHILLCEDHPLNAEIAKKQLQQAGCTVEWAENGSVGVDVFEKSTPGYFDAVLMDIRMPVMDGLEAAEMIRKSEHHDAKSIPIIAMSANAYEEDIRKSLEAGMNAHLAKPVNPQMLIRTLAKYMK